MGVVISSKHWFWIAAIYEKISQKAGCEIVTLQHYWIGYEPLTANTVNQH